MHPIVKKTVAVSLSLALTAALMTGCSKKEETFEDYPAAPTAAPATVSSVRQMRQGLQTFLIVSLTDIEPAGNSMAIRNRQKADLLMMLIMDEASGTATSLQLNPDSIVTFTPQGTSESAQIPLGEVFSYGSGGSDSCLNISGAVSRLLNWVPVQHYLFFTRDAVGIVNDLIGGVEVTITDAFPDSMPGLAKGENLRLCAEDIVTFFDYRDAADTANEAHMRRQQQYIAHAFGPFAAHMQEDNFLTKLTLQLGDRLATDLTLSQMVQTMELMNSCTLDETVHTLPGQVGSDGFHPDPDGVRALTDELFYD